VLGLLLTAVVMRRDEDNEHANQAIPITLSLLALQLIDTLVMIPLVFSEIRDGVIYVIPLQIPFLITILLLESNGITLRTAKNLRRYLHSCTFK
jgi:hypothetical protein